MTASGFCPDDCRGQHSVIFEPTLRSDAILNPKPPFNDSSYDDLAQEKAIEVKSHYT